MATTFEGCPTEAMVVILQPLESVTVKLISPTHRAMTLGVVRPPDHLYENGAPKPPLALAATSPSHLP